MDYYKIIFQQKKKHYQISLYSMIQYRVIKMTVEPLPENEKKEKCLMELG